MNTNFKVIGLTPLGIKPKSTASEADALTTRPSELLEMLLSTTVLAYFIFDDYWTRSTCLS